MAAILNCLPKSGTHLARKCFDLILGPEKYRGHLDISQNDDELVEKLVELQGGVWCTAHLPCREPFAFMITRFQQKHFVVIRDPRDIAVSFTKYVMSEEGHPLHSYYVALPDDSDRLLTTLRGVTEASGARSRIRLDNIWEAVEKFWTWLANGTAQEIRFERLVGPLGGGSKEVQISEITRILKYLDLSRSNTEILSVAEQCFDRRSTTFRRGQIGDWKNHFSSEHKAVFKDIAGELLIDLEYERDRSW